VGGGSGFRRLQGVWVSVKAKSFHVLICKHTLCIVQERLLEMLVFGCGFSPMR
jgi:hypothetical protein